MSTKWVYLYNEVSQAEEHVGGEWELVRALLGGKGANLADMTRVGLPVPPGFTVTTEACNAYLPKGQQFPAGCWEQELEAMKATRRSRPAKIWRPGQPAVGFLPLRGQILDAGDDGHRP
jgi:pyruvate,orthophosphate dikinase